MDDNRFWILAAKKLSGELTGEEKNELELLFVSNAGFRQLYQDLENTLSDNSTTNIINEEKLLGNLRAKLSVVDPQHFLSIKKESIIEPAEPKHFYWKKLVLPVSVLVLVAIAAWQFLLQNKITGAEGQSLSANNISTRPGSKTQVKLPDGTLVILNADSKLSYPDNFLGATRDVTLEGEAFFEVTENKAKPFIIHSKAMDIKVLGTVFNVKAYPGELSSEAALIKGSIEVTLKNRRNEKIMLKPSEKITVANSIIEGKKNEAILQHSKAVDATPEISLKQVDYDKTDSLVNEIAWTQNRLVFNNENFEDILLLLERWYGKQIEIRTAGLKELKFTGKFNNETIDQVLKALQLSHRFNYKRENEVVVIF